jgi:hypothetical protein
MASTGITKRSRTRRAGESMYGLLLLAKNVAMTLIALLILVAGVWSSWSDAKPTILTKGLERGTLTVSRCDDDWCTGRFTPGSRGGEARARVRVDAAVSDGTGERLLVAIKPGTDEVVRTGAAGILHAGDRQHLADRALVLLLDGVEDRVQLGRHQRLDVAAGDLRSVFASIISTLDRNVRKNCQFAYISCRTSVAGLAGRGRPVPTPNQPGTIWRVWVQPNTHGMARRPPSRRRRSAASPGGSRC